MTPRIDHVPVIGFVTVNLNVTTAMCVKLRNLCTHFPIKPWAQLARLPHRWHIFHNALASVVFITFGCGCHPIVSTIIVPLCCVICLPDLERNGAKSRVFSSSAGASSEAPSPAWGGAFLLALKNSPGGPNAAAADIYHTVKSHQCTTLPFIDLQAVQHASCTTDGALTPNMVPAGGTIFVGTDVPGAATTSTLPSARAPAIAGTIAAPTPPEAGPASVQPVMGSEAPPSPWRRGSEAAEEFVLTASDIQRLLWDVPDKERILSLLHLPQAVDVEEACTGCMPVAHEAPLATDGDRVADESEAAVAVDSACPNMKRVHDDEHQFLSTIDGIEVVGRVHHRSPASPLPSVIFPDFPGTNVVLTRETSSVTTACPVVVGVKVGIITAPKLVGTLTIYRTLRASIATILGIARPEVCELRE